ncbi:hypothetical protein FQN50_004519 [Emmonsiellopsis sp. PD_5]|nr:hypothetical protein FQN50_004519 [Emmonsiellopsis sp. PD_5]
MATSLESTPLLADHRSDAPVGDTQQAEDNAAVTGPSGEPNRRAVLLLTWLSVVFSAFAFVLLVIISVVARRFPGYSMDWSIGEACIRMIPMTAAVAFFGFLNLVSLYIRQRALWLALNLVIDALIAFFSGAFCLEGLTYSDSYYCSEAGNEGCEAFAKKIQVLIRVGLGLGLAVALVHVILFLFRCVRALRYLFRQRSSGTFKIPTGRLSIEFTIKLLRQDDAAGSRPSEE